MNGRAFPHAERRRCNRRVKSTNLCAEANTALEFKSRERTQGRSSDPRYPDSTIIKVRNASGADRQRFDVLGLDAPIIHPLENLQAFKNEPALIGAVPESPTHRGKFAILLEPAAANEIACYTRVGGGAVARLNVVNEAHQYADITHSHADYLEGCPNGPARILWKQPGTGVK